MLSFKSFLQLEESIQYHIGKGGFSKILQQKPELKPLLDILEQDANKLYLKYENKTIGNIITFKIITSKDFDVITHIFNKILHLVTDVNIKRGQQINFKYKNTKIILYSSGGRLQNVHDESGNSLKQSTPKTEQQESALVYALNQHVYPSDEEINNNIGFNFDIKWLSHFKKAYNLIINMLGIGTYHYYRDSDKKKLAILNRMTSSKYLPDLKDNWNPSDIWAIKINSNEIVSSRLNAVLDLFDKQQATIYDLNLELDKLFNEKLLLGISIKKIESGNGNIKQINITPDYTDSIKFKSIIPGSKFTYNPAISYIDLNCLFSVMGDDIKYQFRIAPRASSGDLSLYVQGAVYPQTGRWDGAVSKLLINKLTENRISQFKTKITQGTFDTSVEKALDFIDDISFTKWVRNNSSTFINISKLNISINEYEIKRALCLLYFVYEIDGLNDINSSFKSLFLSSTKMNDFSSIHYKVS